MSKPLVAVVGKPNVGKSTFFNKISGERISIVLDTPGVTRDRVYADADWNGRSFTLIDTGGIQLKSNDEMFNHIKRQAEIALDVCDVILFFVDGSAGMSAEDYDVADMLRKTKKPLVLVVNKIDNFATADLSDFYALGLGEPIPISSEHMLGIGDLLDIVVGHFKPADADENESGSVRISVVGKPNVGKSSLVNRLLGFERTIVSNISGTTRDAIDTEFEVDGKKYTLVDTAGIRRKRSIEDETIEQYSVIRSLASIRKADVCLVVLDASDEISEQDVKIAGYVHEQGKPSVVILNKWDLIEKDTHTVEKFNKRLKSDLAFMDYVEPVTVSALTGQRTNKLMQMVDKVFEHASFRVTTGLLNEIVNDAMSAVEPPMRSGKRLKIYYAVQVSVCPPTFIFFVNDAKLMHFSYKRYLENSLRRAFDFSGTPIRLIIRNRNEEQ